MAEISAPTKKLIEKYSLWQQSLKPKGGVMIHVDEVASRIAAFYEYIRTVIDWKEEHLMQRAAIIRKLKMRFFDLEMNNFSGAGGIAEPLVLELIRGGHFPNDKIEESRIGEVQRVIDKYVFILKNSPEKKSGKAGLRFYNWLLEVAACEIEEILSPAIRERALIDYMFVLMKEKIKVSEALYQKGLLKPDDTDVQIYVAVQQALFKLDKPIISYNLIKYKYPNWTGSEQKSVFRITENIYKIWEKVEETLDNPAGKKFYSVCEKYDTPYLLLGDVLSQNDPATIGRDIKEPAILEDLLRTAYKKRLSTLKSRLRRAAVYSTISIFVTKILTLIILEILLAELFVGHLDFLRLIADVLIPTGLMFVLVSTIKRPSEKNLSIALMETMKIVYENEQKDTYEIKTHKKRNMATKFVLSLMYVLGAAVSFGFIIWIFYDFGFPIHSIIINIIFIALILFAGLAVRKRALELTMEDGREGVLSFLSDILFLPVVGMGRWISNKWKRYNAIAAFFNALIDMPFSAFVEFIEGWRYFMKEKKEEIR